MTVDITEASGKYAAAIRHRGAAGYGGSREFGRRYGVCD